VLEWPSIIFVFLFHSFFWGFPYHGSLPV
jgi:hypothetical protein